VRPISVRLPDDLAQALEQEADRLGIGVSDLVRQGVVMRLTLAALHQASEEGDNPALLLSAWVRFAAREARRRR